MKLMEVEILWKMTIGVAMIGAGFMTGCTTVCDIHDPQLANDPMQSALRNEPASMQYGCYYYNNKIGADLNTPIFLTHYLENDKSCIAITRYIICWKPGKLESGHVFTMDSLYSYFPPGEPLNTLLRSRMQSSFHKPIELSLGNKQWWIVYSIIPMPNPRPQGQVFSSIKSPLDWSFRLEFFNKDPSLAPYADAMPRRIWWLGLGTYQNPSLSYTNTLYEVDDTIYRIQKINVAPNGQLSSLQIIPWSPTIEEVLQGLSSWRGHLDRTANTDAAVRMEESLNNLLIEWKTKELPDMIAKADVAHLKEMVIRLEKTILHLDTDSSAIKSAIDKTERFVPDPRDKNAKAPPPPFRGEEIAKLIDQRRILLANVLTVLKQAIAAKG